MSNEEMVILIQSGRDDLMGNLWKQNLGFLIKNLSKYSGYAEMDDLLQESYFGLLQAVQHWNPEKETKFLSYAWYWIRRQIIQYISKDNVNQDLIKMHRFVTQYKQEHHEEPSEAEICSFMGISYRQLKNLRKAENMENMASLDDPGFESIQSEENPEAEVIDQIEREELSRILWSEVDSLPGDRPEVLRRRFQGEETRQKIGEELGRSPERVRQYEVTALRQLRHSKELRSYLDDQIYSEALQGGGVAAFQRKWTSSTERTALSHYKDN